MMAFIKETVCFFAEILLNAHLYLVPLCPTIQIHPYICINLFGIYQV